MHHKIDRAIDSVVCDSFIVEMNVVPTAVTDDCSDG